MAKSFDTHHSEISHNEDISCLSRSQSCLGASLKLRQISTRTTAITKNSLYFLKCRLYFLTFYILLCNDCDAAIPLEYTAALFMARKWAGTWICQDVTLSQTSQYQQPQFLSSILTAPNPPSSQYVVPYHTIFVIFCYILVLHLCFSLIKPELLKSIPN